MKPRLLSRRTAIMFSIIVSVAFWVVVAGLFIGFWSDESGPVAKQQETQGVAPAAGPRPTPNK